MIPERPKGQFLGKKVSDPQTFHKFLHKKLQTRKENPFSYM